MSAIVATVVLALPLGAAAGTGKAERVAAPARAEGIPFTAVDVALLLGGAGVLVAAGSAARRLLRERA